MCPYTKFWQEKIVSVYGELVSKRKSYSFLLVREVETYGVHGVYVDQIGAAQPTLCYDPGHGHGTGGGDYWVSGELTLLTRCMDRAMRFDRAIITGTNLVENKASRSSPVLATFLKPK